jgi:hypothetical protein
MKFIRRSFWKLTIMSVLAVRGYAISASAQYVGATFGFNYNNDLNGPDTGTQNTPLYNPDPNNPNASWDTWVREASQAGVNFLAPNLRGASPITGWSPAGMTPILMALNNSGFAGQIKIAAFDDNAASWTAQWQNANHSTAPFDISNSANWTYIYDTNHKYSSKQFLIPTGSRSMAGPSLSFGLEIQPQSAMNRGIIPGP